MKATIVEQCEECIRGNGNPGTAISRMWSISTKRWREYYRIFMNAGDCEELNATVQNESTVVFNRFRPKYGVLASIYSLDSRSSLRWLPGGTATAHLTTSYRFVNRELSLLEPNSEDDWLNCIFPRENDSFFRLTQFISIPPDQFGLISPFAGGAGHVRDHDVDWTRKSVVDDEIIFKVLLDKS
jgi:hypothetical protein